MAKFNEVQKRRRATLSQQKRIRHGDPVTAKLHKKPQPIAISGKRKRKLFKKWRRDQKEAVEKGLITMQDVEMAVAGGEAASLQNKQSPKFNIKKKSLKIQKIKSKGKKKGTAKPAPATETTVDSMVESSRQQIL